MKCIRLSWWDNQMTADTAKWRDQVDTSGI